MLICALPGAAAAAEATNAPKDEITLELDVKSESNVARGSADRAAQRGLQRADQRATPSLSLTASRPIGPHRFSIDASLGYDFYRRNTRLNRERIEIEGVADLALSLCEVTLTPKISRKQSDLADITPLSGTGSETVRNVETIQDYSGRIACGRRIGLRPYADVDRSIGNNSQIRRSLSDYRTSRYGGGLLYTSPAAGTVTLGYSHAANYYPNRILPTGGNDGYQIDSVDAKLERSIGSRLTGTIGASYVSLKPRRAGVASFNSVTWDIGLTANVGADLQVHGAFSRKVQPSLVTDSLYHVDKLYSLDATYAMNTRTSFKVGFTSAPRKYFGAGPAFGPVLTDDKRNEVFATLSYAQSQRLRFFIDGGYQTRRANDPLFNYDNAYVGLRTQLRF